MTQEQEINVIIIKAATFGFSSKYIYTTSHYLIVIYTPGFPISIYLFYRALTPKFHLLNFHPGLFPRFTHNRIMTALHQPEFIPRIQVPGSRCRHLSPKAAIRAMRSFYRCCCCCCYGILFAELLEASAICRSAGGG